MWVDVFEHDDKNLNRLIIFWMYHCKKEREKDKFAASRLWVSAIPSRSSS